jgi:UDP-N-acetylmuramyl pentapeptide phosphotransferase/UDP-N-acetylglucosamine-1-phosphate transferase
VVASTIVEFEVFIFVIAVLFVYRVIAPKFTNTPYKVALNFLKSHIFLPLFFIFYQTLTHFETKALFEEGHFLFFKNNILLLQYYIYNPMENTTHTIALVSFFASLIAVAIIHPYLVRFAKAKNIVDNPNTRKLQLHPVPVLGGLAIAFGIAAGLLVDSLFCDISPLFTPILCMIIMTYIGVIDDVLDLSPIVRLFVQVGTVLIIIYAGNGLSLDNFHGLLGFTMLPEWVSTPLTIVAVVGIINALNLIDGVDGLFSAFCITTCSIFAAIFYKAADLPLFALAVCAIGSLIPFLLHNVFGSKSKMFAGDGGSLSLGVMLAIFVMEIISDNKYDTLATNDNVGLVAFALATLSIPVFDTVRVMVARICRGISPMIGDKTHLHHMFIALGVSHFGTALLVCSLNLLVVVIWFVAMRAGASIDMQFYAVIAAALVLDWGIYYGVALLDKLIPEKMARFRKWKTEHRPPRKMFDVVRNIVDKL